MKQNNTGWVEYVYGTRVARYCTSTILKKLVTGVADSAKIALERNKRIKAFAFVLGTSVCDLLNLRFYTPKEQQEAYSALGEYSKKVDAHSLIIVQDAKIHMPQYGEVEALITFVLSRRLRDYALVHPYYRHEVKKGKELLVFMDRLHEGPELVESVGNWWG